MAEVKDLILCFIKADQFIIEHMSQVQLYNSAYTEIMDLSHFRIINNECLNKDPYVEPERAPLVILNSSSAICMAKNVKNTKHTRHISRKMHLVGNGEELNLHKKLGSEGGLQLADNGTKNVREDDLNPRLGYDMFRIDNLHNTCTRGVIEYRRV